jgi:hypothetical protein
MLLQDTIERPAGANADSTDLKPLKHEEREKEEMEGLCEKISLFRGGGDG